MVFSAGHSHGHPTGPVVQRIKDINSGAELFRTDLGDDESKNIHWEDDTTQVGCSDKGGDDSVVITLFEDGSEPAVDYVADGGLESCP